MWSQKKPAWQIAENNLLNTVEYLVDDVGGPYVISFLKRLVKRLESEHRYTPNNYFSGDAKRADGRLHKDEDDH